MLDGKNRYTLTMHLVGFQADVERCELLYTSLLLQAANAMQHTPIPAGRDKAAFREPWLEGFAWAIGNRLATVEKKAATDAKPNGTPGVALVLADRSILVEQAYNAAYPNVTTGRARKLSGGGEWHGYKAGERADVGGPGIGGRAAAAIR
jgi:hypothetical protein